jgi:hypothetical protein
MRHPALRFIVRLVGRRDLLFEEQGQWRKHNVGKWYVRRSNSRLLPRVFQQR